MATPTLALIPTGYKAGKLYSVLPESGVGDFTVVRATEGTRVNEDGLIETMGANVPRLDYSAGGCPVLLTEPQRTNLQTYSSDLAAVYIPTNITQTSNYSTAPDGTSTSTRAVLANLTDSRSVETLTGILTNGVTYTFSCYYKGVVGETTYMYFLSSSGGTSVSKLITFTGNWQREEITFTAGSVSNYTYIIDVRQGASTATDFEVWGAQVEQGSYPTSLINTSGSAVTRNADQVYGAGDAATFNDSEGVLMVEISALADDGTNRYISLSDGSVSNRVNIFFDSSNNLRGFYNGLSGSITINANIKLNNKIAFKYKSGDSSFWFNGFEVATRADSLSLSGLDSISLDLGGGSDFYGNTSQVQYFNTALTDLELEKLTSWASFSDMANALNYTIQ